MRRMGEDCPRLITDTIYCKRKRGQREGAINCPSIMATRALRVNSYPQIRVRGENPYMPTTWGMDHTAADSDAVEIIWYDTLALLRLGNSKPGPVTRSNSIHMQVANQFRVSSFKCWCGLPTNSSTCYVRQQAPDIARNHNGTLENEEINPLSGYTRLVMCQWARFIRAIGRR